MRRYEKDDILHTYAKVKYFNLSKRKKNVIKTQIYMCIYTEAHIHILVKECGKNRKNILFICFSSLFR